MDDSAACAATRYADQLRATVERLALAIGRRRPLVLCDGNIHLPTGHGIAGLVVSAHVGARVDAVLPALALSVDRWAFLVDTAGVAVPVLPPRVRLVDGGRYLPLPPSVTADGPVTWVHEPVAALPRLTTVLGLLRLSAPRW
ncbi:hypothetical protein [Saccharothrix hoggarensis]|uniref:Uncharacterized protein n=1 Tax=Saccharothrix hoggarensis TaxID=913853 RepID=A0ABW3R483_9PSEU